MVLSVFSKLVLDPPLHIGVAYLIYGFINTLNICLSVLSWTNVLIFLKIPIPLCNFLFVWSACFSQVSTESKYIPRYLMILNNISWFTVSKALAKFRNIEKALCFFSIACIMLDWRSIVVCSIDLPFWNPNWCLIWVKLINKGIWIWNKVKASYA